MFYYGIIKISFYSTYLEEKVNIDSSDKNNNSFH